MKSEMYPPRHVTLSTATILLTSILCPGNAFASAPLPNHRASLDDAKSYIAERIEHDYEEIQHLTHNLEILKAVTTEEYDAVDCVAAGNKAPIDFATRELAEQDIDKSIKILQECKNTLNRMPPEKIGAIAESQLVSPYIPPPPDSPEPVPVQIKHWVQNDIARRKQMLRRLEGLSDEIFWNQHNHWQAGHKLDPYFQWLAYLGHSPSAKDDLGPDEDVAPPP